MKVDKIFIFCCMEIGKNEDLKKYGFTFKSMDCIGTLGEEEILEVIEKGFNKIIVLGCKKGICKNKIGNILGERRVKEVKKYIKEVDLKEIDVRYYYLKTNELEGIIKNLLY